MKPFALLLLLCSLASPAQQKRPMTFADLQAIKRVSDPQISPSGKWVLFSVTDVSLQSNTKTNSLWAVPIDGSAREHVVTLGSSDGRFSPDGKALLFLSDVADEAIILAPWNEADGTMGGEGHAVSTIGSPADGLVWAPDSRHFLFSAQVYPECESHELSGRRHNQDEINCNAQKDADAAKNPVKALVFDHLLYRHWNTYQGAKHSHIFYGSIDAKDGPPTDLTPASVIGDHEAPTFSLGGPLGYAISPDGREVAYVTNLDKVPAASTNNDIFVLQVGAEPSTAKKVSTSPGSDDGPQYSPDGKWLAWRSQARKGFESDRFRLFLLERNGNARPEEFAQGDNWVDEFVWSPDSGQLYVAEGYHGAEALTGLVMRDANETSIGVEVARIRRISGKGEFASVAVTPDGSTLITSGMRVDLPSEIFSFESAHTCDSSLGDVTRMYVRQPSLDNTCLNGDPARQVTHLNANVTSLLSLSPLEPFWFKGASDSDVEGFIVKPPNFDPAKKYPVKFLMHGGPQTAFGDSWSYRWNWELFAANGYVVVGINRRGSTGYGQKFVDEISGDWGGKAYIDLMKGLDYAEAKFPFIDKNRECALGASYGGFMANWVLTHTDRFKCIVTHDGMYNPQSAWGSTEEMWFNEWEFRPTTANGMVEQTKPAQPWDFVNATNAADPFRKFSPMLHIKNARTPTLVIHSQRDYRLDVSEGFQLFSALQRLGVPSKMLYFPDEGHWVLKPQNSQLWYETVNDWCDRWLGMNKYASVGPEVTRSPRKP